MIAYKFLTRDGRGPITLWPWPRPSAGAEGAWVEAGGPLGLCRHGVHACRVDELVYWIHEDLWRVELNGPFVEGQDCVVAARARLVGRIEAWSGGGAQRFAVAVRDHAAAQIAHHPERPRLQGYVDDASWHVDNGFPESPALAALCSAMAVAQTQAGPGSGDPVESAYRRERAWQSAWIAREMRLT
ncbi:MAG TPA: hypothetical protein VHO67_22405 [Polyangia bacterium]|nr:hypothetical protein [Polyangia bacterium]